MARAPIYTASVGPGCPSRVSMNFGSSLAVFAAISIASTVAGNQPELVDKCIFYSENLLHVKLMVALQFLYYMAPLRQLYLDQIPSAGTVQFGLKEAFKSMQTCNENPSQYGNRVPLDSSFATQVMSQFGDQPPISLLISRILSWSPFSLDLLFQRRYRNPHYSNVPEDVPAEAVDLMFSRLAPPVDDLIEIELCNGDEISDKLQRPSSIIPINGQNVVRTMEIIDTDDLLVVARVSPDSYAFGLPLTLMSLPGTEFYHRLLHAVIKTVPEEDHSVYRVYVCKDYSRRHWYSFTFGRQFHIEEVDHRHFILNIEPGEASLALFIDHARRSLYETENGVNYAPRARLRNILSSHKSVVWTMIAVFWFTIFTSLLLTIIKVRQWRTEAKTLI